MSYRGPDEIAWALKEADGTEVWHTTIAPANHKIGFDSGSRSTPTVDGDRLYMLGVSGDLACLSAVDGKILWKKNLVTDFGGAVPGWGYSESPLVDGDRVIATPGGAQATLVALNKMTGAVVWKCAVPGGLPAGYSSVIKAVFDGQEEYIQLTNGGLVGVSAADGKLLWRYDRPANKTASISTPIYHDGMVFAASAYGTGGGVAKLARTPDGGVSASTCRTIMGA
jgi:outer membrane protein assembly factor BamB